MVESSESAEAATGCPRYALAIFALLATHVSPSAAPTHQNPRDMDLNSQRLKCGTDPKSKDASRIQASHRSWPPGICATFAGCHRLRRRRHELREPHPNSDPDPGADRFGPHGARAGHERFEHPATAAAIEFSGEQRK